MTAPSEPTQRIVKIRRDYNTWVANETIEDYALRFTPRAFRKWSVFRVANTAFGAISFLVLEAIGGTIAINYGFVNAFWAIVAVGLIIFATGLPISYYAAQYGVDMDLLTRGAGFGYIGSTISSFVYASFTFILFALEAAIMAYALELYFGLPLWLGYLASALAVIPLVTHGVTLVSRIQMLTQPVWLVLLALPFVAIAVKAPHLAGQLAHFGGAAATSGQFALPAFGAATAVGVALITQIGEQVDYLRFMPERTPSNRLGWHLGVLVAGPGWILLGIAKMLGGALLAMLAIGAGATLAQAVNPNQMYLAGFRLVFADPATATLVTALFVVVSQVKINMTNAYAGSLAWSNFFARLTHSHPGRVVWAVFNALIAVLLMELDVFQALEQVLGLYANVAIAWIAAVVADLVINKPLGLSPPGIEFRRAYLYDINPVGVGAMLLASVLSIAAFCGLFGPGARAFAAFIALGTALVSAPLIAWATRGRFYMARQPEPATGARTRTCCVCEREYETDDMAHCPAYQGPICSLCCCLDARCNDACKPHARFARQWEGLLKAVLPQSAWPYLTSGLAHYLLLMLVTLAFLGGLLGLLYAREAATLGAAAGALLPHLRLAFLNVFGALLLVSSIVAWWLVLTSESRRVAQEESNRQTSLLVREIALHGETDAQLQLAKKQADQANQAKSRYIAAISHEIRTPLNSILGYAQLLDDDPAIPPHRRQAIRVIRGSGEHLLSLIEGSLDIARIESGRLRFDVGELDFPGFLTQIVRMFEQQAASRGLTFRYEASPDLPAVVRADRKRLGQILMNIVGNAVKFTERGGVVLRVRYAREMTSIEVEDTGPGIPPEELERIFEPFGRGSAAGRPGAAPGTGLGLPISKMLVQLMGGELLLESVPGRGTTFRIRLLLPRVHGARAQAAPAFAPAGYAGRRRRILVVDNERVDRELLVNILAPLGFETAQAASGSECVRAASELRPDLVLLDLAMPGMDGWETSRILRAAHGPDFPILIVSANAYDKEPDNRGPDTPAGIAAEDFITKPVNVAELLERIGQRLELAWTMRVGQHLGPRLRGGDVVSCGGDVVSCEGDVVSCEGDVAACGGDDDMQTTSCVIPAQAGSQVQLPATHLAPLREQVKLGYMRGIRRELDALAAFGPDHAVFVETLRAHAMRFDLEAIKRLLEQGESDAHPL